MLFSNTASDSVRDKLIKLVEATAYCLHILGEKELCHDEQIESAYRELSEAMAVVIDVDVAHHSEYDYILYRARLKLKMHLSYSAHARQQS